MYTYHTKIQEYLSIFKTVNEEKNFKIRYNI